MDEHIRALTRSDLPNIRRLLELAEWAVDDARLTLYLAVGTWFGFDRGAGVEGMITLFPHGDGMWSIGNVIVHPKSRRQGIAGRLLEWAVASVATPARFELIATEFGYPLYAQQGFTEFDSVARLRRAPTASDVAPQRLGWRKSRETPVFGRQLEGIDDAAWAHIARLESAVSGIHRPAVLRAVAAWPGSWIVCDCESVAHATSFCLCLPVRDQVRIGPLVAPSDVAAEALLNHALMLFPGVITLLDVPTAAGHTRGFLRLAERRGFRVDRHSPMMSKIVGESSAGLILPADRRFALLDPAML